MGFVPRIIPPLGYEDARYKRKQRRSDQPHEEPVRILPDALPGQGIDEFCDSLGCVLVPPQGGDASIPVMPGSRIDRKLIGEEWR